MVTRNAANEPTAAAGTVLQGQGVGVASEFSTATYPSTTTANQILYSSATNTVGEITTANNSVVLTNGSGVPSLGTSLSNDFTFTKSTSGATTTLTVSNTSNTASSAANILAQVAGGTAADATHQATISGGQAWTWGLDNSDSDAFVISASTSLGTSNVFRSTTAGQVSFSSASTDVITATCTDAGAGTGPILDLYRNSASPAAADVLGSIPFNGVDSGSAKQEYARIESRIVTTTAGAENGALALYTTSSGTSTKQVDLLNTGGQYRGNNTNTAPPAGYIGELIESVVANGTVAMTTATPNNITSISLTAGIWNVSGIVSYDNSSGTGNTIQSSINTTSATIGSIGNNAVYSNNVAGTQGSCGVIPDYRLTISSTTTVYLVGLITIASGTISCGGRISATRVG